MFRKIIILQIVVLGVIFGIVLSQAFSKVIEEQGKTYIVDWHGERWDISQAMTRDAFTPLDDSHFSKDNAEVKRNLRVIGIAEDDRANAYAISKLWRHEVANSFIGEKPITAAY
jgi:hypothetical protein